MLSTTISDYRKDIKKYLNRVTENFEALILNRGKETDIVIVSLDGYNSLTTAQHEFSSKKNKQRLDSAIEKLKKGASFKKELIEPRNISSLTNHGRIICIGK